MNKKEKDAAYKKAEEMVELYKTCRVPIEEGIIDTFDKLKIPIPIAYLILKNLVMGYEKTIPELKISAKFAKLFDDSDVAVEDDR